MKTITQHITERLQLNKDRVQKHIEYFPETKEALQDLLRILIPKRGTKADLNDIDVSKIKDMSYLFSNSYVGKDKCITRFNGDISDWNVSHVENMEMMFFGSSFNNDISHWDVSSVKNMWHMFAGSKFNKDISKWDVSHVEDMTKMFLESKFDGDLSEWDTRHVKAMSYMFYDSNFTGKKGTLSRWNVQNVKNMNSMFENTEFNQDLNHWKVNQDTHTVDMFKNSPLARKKPDWYKNTVNKY